MCQRSCQWYYPVGYETGIYLQGGVPNRTLSTIMQTCQRRYNGTVWDEWQETRSCKMIDLSVRTESVGVKTELFPIRYVIDSQVYEMVAKRSILFNKNDVWRACFIIFDRDDALVAGRWSSGQGKRLSGWTVGMAKVGAIHDVRYVAHNANRIRFATLASA